MGSEAVLSEAEELKIKKKLREVLAVDRHVLLQKFPFIGNLSMSFELVPVRDVRVPTACTNGSSIYFDCDFYSSLSQSERVFVFAHEVFHCMLLHFSRRQSRNPDLFNIATDMEVNHLLKSNFDSNGLMSCPREALFPPTKLEGKSAEVIYDYLKKNAGEDGDSGSDGDGKSQANGRSQPTSGNSKSSSAQGQSKIKGQFDTHVYNTDINEDGCDEGISDRWGKKGLDKDFNPGVDKNAVAKVRKSVVAAAQQYERTKGSLPAGLENVIKSIKKPLLSWKELLAEFVTKCYGGDMTYLPPNRRHVYNDMYFQSRRSDRMSVAVCIDTSGSCIQDLAQFFGELKGLVESFGSYEVNLYMADADIASHEVYDDGNPLELDVGKGISWKGGGGTSFIPFFKALDNDSEHETKCAIYLTDGFGDAPTTPPPYPVLWVITNGGTTDFCSWGEKIPLKEQGYDY